MRTRGTSLGRAALSSALALALSSCGGAAATGAAHTATAPDVAGDERTELAEGATDADAAVAVSAEPEADPAELHASVRDATDEREAERLLAIADEALALLRGLSITDGPFTDGWAGRVRSAGRSAAEVAAAYDRVLAHHSVERSIAALVGAGEAYDILARALSDAPLSSAGGGPRVVPLSPTPTPFAPPPASVPPSVPARVRAALQPEIHVVECLAVYRYVLAARIGRASAIDDVSTRAAVARLHAEDEQHVGACVELMRAGDSAHNIPADPTIPAYTPGELGAAPPPAPQTASGENDSPEAPAGPPPPPAPIPVR